MVRIEVLAPVPTDPDTQALMRRLISLRVNPMFNTDRIPTTYEIQHVRGYICVDRPGLSDRVIIPADLFSPDIHIPIALITDLSADPEVLRYVGFALETSEYESKKEDKVIFKQTRNYFNSSFCCPVI